MKRQNKKYAEGWSFIETLIVMAIILILTAAVGLSATKQIDKARIVTAKSQIETLSLALDSYYMDNGFYPTTEQGLLSLWEKPSLTPEPEFWNGPYISKSLPKDPWGTEYKYIIPGENNLPFGIISYGKDKIEGGSGNAADIKSWE